MSQPVRAARYSPRAGSGDSARSCTPPGPHGDVLAEERRALHHLRHVEHRVRPQHRLAPGTGGRRRRRAAQEYRRLDPQSMADPPLQAAHTREEPGSRRPSRRRLERQVPVPFPAPPGVQGAGVGVGLERARVVRLGRRRVRDDPPRHPPRHEVHRRRAVGAHEARGIEIQPRRVERDGRDRPRVVRRPQHRGQPAGGVRVEDDDAVPLLLAHDPHRLGDLLVVDEQVRRVVREGPLGQVRARPPAAAHLQGVELEARLIECVREVGLEEVVGPAVDVQHRPRVTGGAGVAPVDEDRVIRPGRSVGRRDGNAARHPGLAQEVREDRGHAGIVDLGGLFRPASSVRDFGPGIAARLARPRLAFVPFSRPSRAAERPGSTTLQQPPVRVRVLPPGPMEDS